MNEILKKRIEEAAIKVSDVCEPCDYGDPFCASCHRPYMYDAAKKMGEVILNNQWISVDGALPEYGECVLTHFEGEDEVGEMFSQRSELSDNLTLDKNGFQVVGFTEVTYWMPIPKLKGSEK